MKRFYNLIRYSLVLAIVTLSSNIFAADAAAEKEGEQWLHLHGQAPAGFLLQLNTGYEAMRESYFCRYPTFDGGYAQKKEDFNTQVIADASGNYRLDVNLSVDRNSYCQYKLTAIYLHIFQKSGLAQGHDFYFNLGIPLNYIPHYQFTDVREITCRRTPDKNRFICALDLQKPNESLVYLEFKEFIQGVLQIDHTLNFKMESGAD